MISVSTSCHDAQLKLNRPSSIAEDVAQLSEKLLPLMNKYRLSLSFSPVNKGGLCIADATCNPTNAYKARGALASTFAAQAQGASAVWTASAGNHGAGLAHAAQMLGLEAMIYVPKSAPQVKVAKIESFGARVIRAGDDFDTCLVHARAERAATKDRSVFVHPFDEQMVVAGQGTIGFEILRQAQRLAEAARFEQVRIFVPIGGGGLAAGVASVIKTRWPAQLPPPEIVGVVDESSPASVVGAFFGRPVQALPDTIADGTRVARVGETFIAVASLIDHIVLVPHDELVGTMRDYYQFHNKALEPSGALALAGEQFTRRHHALPNTSRSLSFAILSGANVDLDTFAKTLSSPVRMDRASHQRCAFDVIVRERDGELLTFLRSVAGHNIASLTYKQSPQTPFGTIRAEFEVARSSVDALERTLLERFPGSQRLSDGKQACFSLGEPVAQVFRDELVILDDRPGSFLRYTEDLEARNALGSVGFLFYRKPAQPGSPAQVVIGKHLH